MPLAFVSHFVLDALPHFGFRDNTQYRQHRSLHLSILTIDVLLSTLLIGWLIALHRFDLVFCAIIAWSPDMVWVYRFVFMENFGRIPPPNTHNHRLINFHINIQKYERIWGLGVEIVYGVAILMLIIIVGR